MEGPNAAGLGLDMGVWSRRNWLTLAALGGFAFGGVRRLRRARGRGSSRPGAAADRRPLWLRTLLRDLRQRGRDADGRRPRAVRPRLLPRGVLLFSGSLYGMALGGPHILGVVTPIGGLSFLAGWAVLAWAARGVDPDPRSGSPACPRSKARCRRSSAPRERHRDGLLRGRAPRGRPRHPLPWLPGTGLLMAPPAQGLGRSRPLGDRAGPAGLWPDLAPEAVPTTTWPI